MGARRMVAAAIAGACCVAVGAVLMASAARSAAATVPVSIGPGGMLVFNPANVTAHQGETVKWMWDSKIRSVHATFTHKTATEHQPRECHGGHAAVQRPDRPHRALSPTRPA